MEHLLGPLKKHDPDTYYHSVRVADLAFKISKKLNFSERDQKYVYFGGLLHDIGKLKIDKEILRKPGKLTIDEWEQIKLHPVFGYEILENQSFIHKEIMCIVLFHHERINGSGYPYRFSNNMIPLNAQIVAVADAFDAMTNIRSYSKARSKQEAIKELQLDKGFSPILVNNLLQVVNGLESVSLDKVEDSKRLDF